MSQLDSENPGELAPLWVYVSDPPYSTPWGEARFDSYASPGLPDAWFDGSVHKAGAIDFPSVYAAYTDLFNQRHAVPTDVTIEVGAVPVSDATYTLQARVCVDTGGAAKWVRIYIARALDNYPVGAQYYRNCLMDVAPTADLVLLPGQPQVVERTMTFDATSWARQGDIRVFAWAQVPGDSGVRAVHQSALAAWPLVPLLTPGDMNCDGSVSFKDINPFVVLLSTRD